MSRAKKILEAVLDPTANVDNVLTSRVKYHILSLLMKVVQKTSHLEMKDVVDDQTLNELLQGLNNIREFRKNGIYFIPVEANSVEIFSSGGAATQRKTNIQIELNINSRVFMWRQEASHKFKKVLLILSSVLSHELVHSMQNLRNPVVPKKQTNMNIRDFPDAKSLKFTPSGNQTQRDYGKYLSSTAEVMAFAQEVAQLLKNPATQARAQIIIRNYRQFTGVSSPAYKKFARYLADYLQRFRWSPQDISQVFSTS